MKILILWREPLHPFHPSSARPYYFIKYFSPRISSVTILAPSTLTEKTWESNSVGKVKLKLYRVPDSRKFLSRLAYSVYNRLSLTNFLITRNFNFARMYYPSFQSYINDVLKAEDFDIIYSDYFVAFYIYRLKLLKKVKAPVIVDFTFPILYGQRQFFKYGDLPDKLLSISAYLLYRLFEVNTYKYFDGGIYVSKRHLELSKPFVPRRCFVIPPGVDVGYFKPLNTVPTDPIILFTGGMHHLPNISAVLWFYHKVYPYIKQAVPNIKFYIVGRNPVSKIKKLASDETVIVTGRVEDVRPYFGMASVFVNPIIVDDGGIKTKVLEAMAMGKAVVSTPLGARDIGAMDGKNIVIARNEVDFANKVIELLRDENERKRIGREARKFVEENYSWERQSKALYDVLKYIAKEARA